MERFCVKCGKKTNALIESLCPDCYQTKHEIIALPKEMTVDYDMRSENIRIGRDWLAKSDETLSKMIADKLLSLSKPQKLDVKGLAISIEHSNEVDKAKVLFSTEIDGVVFPVEKHVTVKFNKTISDTSMKIASYYHEAIIQVRFREKPTLEEGQAKLKEVLSKLAEQKKKIALSEAIDTKNVRGGVDVLVGSAKAAKIVSKRLGRKYGITPIYSNKLLGLSEDGKTKYRHTYCLKF